MGILSKKVYRDLRYNKGRSLSIILIVALATALYGGLFLAYVNISETFDNNEEKANIESVRFIINGTNPALIDTLDLGNLQSVDAWDYRLSMVTSLELDGDDKTYTAAIFGVPGDRRPKVNDFIITDDEVPEYFDGASSQTIFLIEQFVHIKDLEMGDQVNLYTPSGVQKITIESKVFSPEYIYNVNPKSGLPDVSGLAAGWLTLDYAQEIFELENQVNEVLILFKDDIVSDVQKFNAAIDEIKTELSKVTDPNQISFVKLEDEAEQVMKDADVGALDDMARVFGMVILLLALFAIYDNVSKLISSQRNYIGTMRALGGSKSTITIHYTSMGAILGSIGVAIGIPLGWGIASAMTVEYAHLLGIPTPSTTFAFAPFIESIVLILGLSVLLSFLSSIAASRIEPREAMSSSFVTMIFDAKPMLERFFTKIPGLKSVSSAIPIRGLFRNKKRTLITIFTYSMSLVLMIAALGFMDSFTSALDKNYDENQKYDLQLFYYSSIDPNEVVTILNGIEGIGDHEGFISDMVELSSEDKSLTVPLYGFEKNSNLRKISLDKGGLDGLVLGVNLANNLGVKHGGNVDLFGSTAIIKGIMAEILADVAFLPLDDMQEIFELENNVTGTILTIADGFNENDVKKNLLNSNLPIALVISTAEVKEAIETLIQGLMAIVGIMVFVGFVTVALFSFNTVVLDVMARQNEFVNLRSLGASKKKIAKIIALQGFLIAIVGAIVSIPLSYYITQAIINSMIEGLMVLPTVIYPSSYGIGIISAWLASLIGVWAAIRYVMKIDMVDALRTRMSN